MSQSTSCKSSDNCGQCRTAPLTEAGATLARVEEEPPVVGTVLEAGPSRCDDQDDLCKKQLVVNHILQSDDTLASLALRYGSRPEDIMRANALIHSDLDLLPLHCILKVPLTLDAVSTARKDASMQRDHTVPLQERQQRLANLFSQEFMVPVEEALFYLLDNDFDAASARKALLEDQDWEKRNQRHMRAKVSRVETVTAAKPSKTSKQKTVPQPAIATEVVDDWVMCSVLKAPSTK